MSDRILHSSHTLTIDINIIHARSYHLFWVCPNYSVMTLRINSDMQGMVREEPELPELHLLLCMFCISVRVLKCICMASLLNVLSMC